MKGISVIIPCHQMGHFLPDALNSIMRQSTPVEEIIVVDSGSGDSTEEAVLRFLEQGAPARLVQGGANGPGSARNIGLRQAQGSLIGFLDADDLWPREKLSRQLDFLDAHPTMDMVSGFVTYFDVLDALALAPAEDARTETVFGVHVGTSVYRRSVFERIGLFDESFLYSEDVDLFLRVREADVPFTILREVTLYYRRHDNSMMVRKDARKTRDFRRAVACSIARRRRGGMAPVNLDMLENHLEQLR